MNEWHIAAAVVLVAIAVCGWVCARRELADGVVALGLAGNLAAVALILIARAEEREPFADLALVLAALSFAGTLGLARFVERDR